MTDTRDSSVVGIVLAAGAGRRFRGTKQLAPFRGRPLIEHPVRAMVMALGEPVLVILGSRAETVAAGADLGGAGVVVCRDWREGQAASLRCGIEAARSAVSALDAVVVILGDQPLIVPDAVRRVVGARRRGAQLARATYEGRPGHPVLLGSGVLDRALALSGDAGARELFGLFDHEDVPCDGLGSAADADTPEELAELESGS